MSLKRKYFLEMTGNKRKGFLCFSSLERETKAKYYPSGSVPL